MKGEILKVTIEGIFEGVIQNTYDGKVKTSMILNQIGEEEKVKIACRDGFVIPKAVGELVRLPILIQKGSFQGKPYVSVKTI